MKVARACQLLKKENNERNKSVEKEQFKVTKAKKPLKLSFNFLPRYALPALRFCLQSQSSYNAIATLN